MKKLITILLLTISFQSLAQCNDCRSIEEANKSPLEVRLLRINSFVDKVTLDSVPASLAKMSNIKILYLTDQNIRQIPSFIGSLQKLEEISFAGCKLESVPAEIFSLANLKELILIDNNFSEEYKEHIRKLAKEKLPRTYLLLN
jgi:Leucine-rich repeat (LRR) protein